MGVPNVITLLMSFAVFAGASQFIAVNLLTLGASLGEIVLTTFMLNLRHFLMTTALSRKLDESVSKTWRAVLAFGVTDETFSVSALRKEERLPKQFILGLNTIAFLAWNAGTWLGVFFAPVLPEAVKASMGIALYAMFIGLLVPHIKKSQAALVVAAIAAATHGLLYWLPLFAALSSGWRIIIATVVSATAGAILFAKEEDAA
jgi:4-azaleucine resistance transporter AzlC